MSSQTLFRGQIDVMKCMLYGSLKMRVVEQVNERSPLLVPHIVQLIAQFILDDYIETYDKLENGHSLEDDWSVN